VADGQGVPPGEAYDGAFDDAESWIVVHDGGMADPCAGAGAYVHGARVPDIHGA